MRQLQRTHQKGSAATEIIFSLPVILLCLGVTVYVGTMMKARLEMLKAVQQLARECAIGQAPSDAAQCVIEVVQAKDFEDWLDRCNTEPSILATVNEYAKRDFTGIVDGLGEPSLENRREVSLHALRVEGSCAVRVQFPLRFAEFSVFEFEIAEQAVMPLRVERTNRP